MTREEEREEIYNSVIQDFEYLNSYILNDTEKQTIITDIVELVLQTKYDQ
tara:strand:+ start:67 stop:216 length:150 start_codon:yes stop_codon:yes gene_type:complete